MNHRAPTPTPSLNPVRRRRNGPGRLLAPLAVVALVLAGCGADDDTATDATTPPTTLDTAEAPATEDQRAPAVADGGLCDAWVVTDREGSALGSPEVPPAVVAEATEAIEAALIEVDAPDEVADALGSAVEAVRAAGDGDPSAFETPAFTDAVLELGAWVHENCGFASVEVTYVDHAFDGLDRELDAGTTSFRFGNQGVDAHVFVLHRIRDDVDLSDDEIVAAMEPDGSTALEDNTDPVVTGGFAAPGGEGFLTADLDAGRYLAFCPIPSGFTGDGPPPANAPPHIALGMHREFTVG